MKIVCFGDSNTYGYDPRSYFWDRYSQENRWVNILAERLQCCVINEGENGREIPHNKWQMTAFEQILASEKDLDLLIVMLGTNDLLQDHSAVAVAARMEEFLHNINLRQDQILLMAPPILRLGEWVPSKHLVNESRILNECYRVIAKELKLGFADTAEWNIPIAFDGVHFTQEGHRVLADRLAYYLRKGA